MKNGEETNLRSQMLGIGSYGAQGFGGGLKENVIDHLLVLVSDRGNLIRDGEDDMEILAVENLRLSVFYPVCAGERLTLGAMTIPAGPVADTLLTACITLFDLSSESRRPAYLDGGHDASLRCGHRRTVLVSIGLAVAAEDVRHFQLRAIHSPELRKTEESKAWDQRRLYEARGRVDLMSNRPCWWRSSGIVRSSPDYGGREEVEYFEHLCRIQVDERQIHVAENEA
jgi:hypothetical protein